MGVTREEQETIIRLGYNDDELTLSTTNPAHQRHMERLGFVPSSVCRVATKWAEVVVKRKGEMVTEKGAPIEWEDVAWSYKAPAAFFKLPRPKRQVSEEQRQASAARMRQRHLDLNDDGEDDE